MKAIMNCPFIPIATRVQSHRGALGVIYADQLKQTGVDVEINWAGKIEDHNQFDEMYVYHGSDWTGGLNFFGGVAGFPYVENTRNFSQFKGKVYSLEIPFPPYHEMIKERIDRAMEKGTAILDAWKDVDLDNLKRMHDTAEVIKYPKVTRNLVIGDSHSICMYRPEWTVNSVPFKTLNGAINSGLHTFIEDVGKIEDFDKLEVYFGNIDVRHHLCRIGDNVDENVKDLAKRYVEAVEAVDIKEVYIYELLPIEDESRKLPKSGFYKNKPFWGTWEQRNRCRLLFRDYIEQFATRAKIIRWTDYLLNKEGQLDFKHMEMPHSIHLSRGSYPHWTGEEKPNTLEEFFV
tara:strand:+ start:3161 stop:4198 length:1038 start_codon:yes stop_codon:yes gene_type:complete